MSNLKCILQPIGVFKTMNEKVAPFGGKFIPQRAWNLELDIWKWCYCDVIFIIKILYINNDSKTLKSVHCKNNKNIYFKIFSKMKYRALNHLDEIIKMTKCKL